MGKIYGSTKVCIDGNEDGDQCYNLEPGLTDIMAESTNYTLRTLVWEVCIRVHLGRSKTSKFLTSSSPQYLKPQLSSKSNPQYQKCCPHPHLEL